MKICPECAFANEERFPTCIWCNVDLSGVRSTPSPDPLHPEHARQQLIRQRNTRRRGQLRFAAGTYALVATLLMILPGMIFEPWILLVFTLAAGAVGLAICYGNIGAFAAMFLQGSISTAFLFFLHSVGVFTIFMLVGHVVLPAVMHQWVELIETAHD